MPRQVAKAWTVNLWGAGCLLALVEAVVDPDGGIWFWTRALVFAGLCVATVAWLAITVRDRRSSAPPA